MIRVRTLQVQARLTCDRPGCGHTIELPAREPSLAMDEQEIKALTVIAPHMGWQSRDEEWGDGHLCPDHATPST